MALACGGEQLRQLNQLPLCDGLAHKDRLPGRHRRPISASTPEPVFEKTGHRLAMRCSQQWHYRTYLRLHNPTFGFGPTTGVFMACRCPGLNGAHHRLELSLLFQLPRRHTTQTPHRQHH